MDHFQELPVRSCTLVPPITLTGRSKKTTLFLSNLDPSDPRTDEDGCRAMEAFDYIRNRRRLQARLPSINHSESRRPPISRPARTKIMVGGGPSPIICGLRSANAIPFETARQYKKASAHGAGQQRKTRPRLQTSSPGLLGENANIHKVSTNATSVRVSSVRHIRVYPASGTSVRVSSVRHVQRPVFAYPATSVRVSYPPFPLSAPPQTVREATS